ncbi:MAG: hypothetical protein J0H17_03950 [Rhizobiales bacterium]|nr:hypothetical protein [Hyphomicrobiales bacterium]
MTVLAIPDQLPVAGLSFYPQPMIEVTPLRSGRQISADIGPTLWRAAWSTDKMTPDEAGIVRAFYDRVLSTGEFYGYDKLREFPLAYRTGWGALTVSGLPFSGNCRLLSVDANKVDISLDQLPAGFKFSPGDYLAFDYLRVSTSATANGGGALTVAVRPYVRPGWAVNATVMLYRPAARMIILPGTYTDPTTAPWFTTASFEAVQTL